MVYYPDSRFRKTRFRIKGRVYQKRREYDSRLQFAKKENRRSAELSRSLGGSVISSFRKYGLPTHRGRTVRGYFYRRGKKSLPAVLRYSKVPTSILVEVANLKNLKDRRSLLISRTRQKMAEALVHSIGQHYQQNEALFARR
jgi:N-acetylmuramoyl-L-alanine amidase